MRQGDAGRPDIHYFPTGPYNLSQAGPCNLSPLFSQLPADANNSTVDCEAADGDRAMQGKGPGALSVGEEASPSDSHRITKQMRNTLLLR